MDIVRNISNFVFGMECLGCGSASERLDPWLCPACRAELERESKEPSFPGADAMCLFPMRPLTRRLVHALKYRSLPGMAAYLVGRSSAVGRGEVAERMGMFAKPFYFVPVPLHPSRFRERGYNQAERIAMALAARLGGRVCRWLSRSSFRVSQTKLSRGEREWNVAGAFVPRLPSRMPGSGTVFVVDDVYTTGATTMSCLAAFGKDFPLDVKVCTLLYDEPASAVMDFAADCRMEWDGGWVAYGKKNAPDGGAL